MAKKRYLHIEIPRELDKRLKEHAEVRKWSVKDYVTEILEKEVPPLAAGSARAAPEIAQQRESATE